MQIDRTPPQWIEFYQKQGFHLFYWERSGDPKNDWKKALGKSWNRRDLSDDFSQFDPAKHNVGTVTGYEVKPGRFLCDVDIDWNPPRELLTLLPASEFVFGRSAKPVSHIFFTTPERLPSVKEYKDIDGKKFLELFGGDFSQYTMIPPSMRAPGEPLVVVQNSGVTHIEVDELYRHLRNYAIAVLLYKHFGKGAVVHDVRLPLAGFLIKSGVSEEDADAIGHAVTMSTGNDINDWKTALKTTVQRMKSGDKVSGRQKLAEALGDVGKKVVAQLIKLIGGSEFIVNEHGKVLADSTENIRTALEKLEVRLFHDEFSEQFLYQNGGPPVLLDDNIRIPLRFKIEEAFRFRPQNELYKEVLADEALRNKVHPVKQYLDSLTWDGVPRLDDWLFTYARAEVQNDDQRRYVRSIGAKHLIAAVRRIREPGCKKDEMLVLESPQGKAKSSGIQALCPNSDWFSDSLPLGVDAQKVVEQTGGKWIIEAAELHGHRGKEVEAIKVFLSRGTDGPVRMAYAHYATHRKRQFIIIGTTNKAAYLKDSTGNRRFWPVRIGDFDLAALRRDRDQIWAEAAFREAKGESHFLEEDLWDVAAIEQEERRGEDPWEETIEQVINGQDIVPVEPLWAALGMHNANVRNNQHAQRVTDIMERYGFVAKRKVWTRDEKGEKRQQRCWVKSNIIEGATVDWSLPDWLKPQGGDPGM